MIPSTHDETKSAYELGLLPRLPGLHSFGGYNTAPEPMTRITAEEYSSRLLHWQVTAIEHRQPRVLGYESLRIHWLNTGNGIGISRAWYGAVSVPKYWLIGCSHSNVTITKTGNCLSERVCQDCGYSTVIDSSG